MIGDVIKKERTKKDITQSELAKAIGVSPSTIGMYEQNRRQPDTESIIKIADYFNVTTDYLLGIEDVETIAAHHDGEKYTDEELEQIEAFKAFVRSKRENKDNRGD